MITVCLLVSAVIVLILLCMRVRCRRSTSQLPTPTSPTLTQAEKAFLSGPVSSLRAKISDWQINHELGVIPDHVMYDMREQGFFGLSIPATYGGLGLSVSAQAQVLSRLASACGAVALCLASPESVVLTQLLLAEGTEEQKTHYLPRLARGEDIACGIFSCDSSDPETAHGLVCEADFAGQRQLCVRLSWHRRGVALSPIAMVLGIAFQLHDPDRLLGDRASLGISCAVLPLDTPGVTRRLVHRPLMTAYPMGVVSGHHVIIPVDWVIGGREAVGHGLEQVNAVLETRKALTISTILMGQMKQALFSTRVLARVSQQTTKESGVQTVLKRMRALVHESELACSAMLQGVDEDTLSSREIRAMLQRVVTHSRQVMLDAMRAHGLKGICLGPSNAVIQGYLDHPVLAMMAGVDEVLNDAVIASSLVETPQEAEVANDSMGSLGELMVTLSSCEPLEKRVMASHQAGVLAGHHFEAWVNEAVSKGLLSAEEGSELITMHAMRLAFLNPDTFPVRGGDQ